MSSHFDYEDVNAQLGEYDEAVLDALGIEHENGYVKCPCPIHGGDNPGGFTYSTKTKRWGCWTHHCHKKYFGDLLGLIRAMKGFQSTSEARRFAEQIIGQRFSEVGKHDLDRRKFIKAARAAGEQDKNKTGGATFSRDFLERFDHRVKDFLAAGVSQDILNEYLAFYCADPKKKLFGRSCLPIFDEDANIVGFSGKRTANLPASSEKWLHAPAEIQMRYYLYNMHAVRPGPDVILVEGPVDVLKLRTHGVQQVVALYGNQMKREQANWLLRRGYRNLLCGFDRDAGGDAALYSTQTLCRLSFNLYDVSSLFDGDPGKSSADVILAAKAKMDTKFDI